MLPPTNRQERLELIELVLDDPPRVHLDATDGNVWRAFRGCYRFMAESVYPGCRTLETGTGISTVLFTAWGCRHLCVAPYPQEVEAITDYCREHPIDTADLTFDVRPSEQALPTLRDVGPVDLMFIDGGHAFPLPIVDWFYGAALLEQEGVVVFDDVELPAVGNFLDTFLERDDRWQRLGGTSKWRAYRRHSAGSLAEHESDQRFYTRVPPPHWRRATRAAWTRLPRTVRDRVGPRLANRGQRP